MSKPKHTRGPWKMLPEEADKGYIRIRGSIPGERYKIANVPTPVYEGVHAREADETRANARLIAAAPELLECLIHLKECDWFNDGVGGGVICGLDADKVRAAISKVTGEKP